MKEERMQREEQKNRCQDVEVVGSLKSFENSCDSMLGGTFKADTITGVYVEILRNFKTLKVVQKRYSENFC